MPIIAAFQGEHHDSGFGTSLVSLDFNHDGYDDLVVCAAFYGYLYPSTPSRGKVYVYYGGPNFSAVTPPAITLEGTYTGTSGRKIGSIYNIGDVNGDGFDDLCILDNANQPNDVHINIFYGGNEDLNTPDHMFSLPVSYYYQRISTLGDVNGDGFDDTGLVYLVPVIGRDYTIKFDIIWGGSYGQETVSEGEASMSYISSMHGIGDINNDGYDDFTTGFSGPPINANYNLIRLYYGNQAGDLSSPVTMIQTSEQITHISVPLGDMNDDGYDDFMGYISISGMHVWLGGPGINYSTPSLDLSPAWYGGGSVRALVFGDFNNDGYSDVIGADNVEKKFSLWLGRQNVNGTSDFIYHRPGSTNFGYSLAAGDYNADGYDDIAVSAPYENDPPPQGTFYGFVWIHAGNEQLTDTTVENDDNIMQTVASKLSIFPNPSGKNQHEWNYRLEGELPLDVTNRSIDIYNIRGQLIASYPIGIQGSKQGTLVELNLAHGVYIAAYVAEKQKVATTRFTIK